MKKFPEVHQRIRMLDLTYTEFEQILGMQKSAFWARMTGRSPFTETEMQRLLYEI